VRAEGGLLGGSIYGQLRRRAQDVADHYLGVVDRDRGGLDGCAEQDVRSADEVLIERVVARHEHTEGRLLGSARATDLLPGGGDRARVAREHDGIKRADVDAELRGRRRHHDVEPSVTEVRLDRAALGRRVAAR